MEILTAVETSYDRLGTLASNIGPGQLDAATSLPGWDVRTLLDHTLGFITAMTDCANGARNSRANAITAAIAPPSRQRIARSASPRRRKPGGMRTVGKRSSFMATRPV